MHFKSNLHVPFYVLLNVSARCETRLVYHGNVGVFVAKTLRQPSPLLAGSQISYFQTKAAVLIPVPQTAVKDLGSSLLSPRPKNVVCFW